MPDLGPQSHYGIVGNGIFAEYEDAHLWRALLSKFSDDIPIEFIGQSIARLRSSHHFSRRTAPVFLNREQQLTVDRARQVYGLPVPGPSRCGPEHSECPFPSYDPDQVANRIQSLDGFLPFDEYRSHTAELATIDNLLARDYVWLLGGLGRASDYSLSEDQRFKLFVGFHLYYTDYCVELARARQLSYLPNPTRVRLIDNSRYFQDRILLENVRADIITRFADVRRSHLDRVLETLSLRSITLDAPLLLNYVLRGASRPEDIIDQVKRIRNDRHAKAFRRFCREIEDAIQAGDLKAVAKRVEETNAVAKKWESSLDTRCTSRRISVKVFNVDPAALEVPDFVIYSKELTKHFVFLHRLVATM